MNTQNETIVSGKLMKEMQKAGLDEGYTPVPRELESRARKLLGKRHVVTYSNDSKLKKKIARLQNRLHEARMREGANSPVVQAQLEALKKITA